MDKLSVEEIEITPDMLEAGLDAISLYDWSDPGDWIVTSIYSAMEKVRRNKDSGVSPDDSFHPTDAGHEKIAINLEIGRLKEEIKLLREVLEYWCVGEAESVDIAVKSYQEYINSTKQSEDNCHEQKGILLASYPIPTKTSNDRDIDIDDGA